MHGVIRKLCLLRRRRFSKCFERIKWSIKTFCGSVGGFRENQVTEEVLKALFARVFSSKGVVKRL